MLITLTIILTFSLLTLSVRGGGFHNYLVEEAASILSLAGFETATEYPQSLPDGETNYIDLAVHHDDHLVAVEVETTARNVLSNARKAYEAGIPLVVVVPNAVVRKAVQNKLSSCQLRPGGKPICILLLAQILNEVMNCFPLIPSANGDGEIKKSNQTNYSPTAVTR